MIACVGSAPESLQVAESARSGASIGDGLHTYGKPIPDGFYPLEIELTPLDGLEVGNLDLSEPHPNRVEGLVERFMANKGEILGSLPCFIKQNHGDLTPEITVGYQACTDSECFPPSRLRLSLPLQALDNVPGSARSTFCNSRLLGA